jgi:dynein heavy chain 2
LKAITNVILTKIYLQLTELSQDLKQLPVNSLLAAAFITYLSMAPEDLRQSLMSEWQDELSMNNFSFTAFLASEKEQLQWLSEGLPSDQLSVQNALIILQVNMLQLSIFVNYCHFGNSKKGMP